MAISQKQLAANRRNAQHSTGPRTEEGKMSSRWNALKHGLTGRGGLLPDEDPQAYAELCQALHAEYRPVGPLEAELVDHAADILWGLRRVRRIKTGILKSHLYQGLVDKLEVAAHEETRSALDPGREKVLRQKEEVLARRSMDIDLGTQGYLMDVAGPDALSKLSRYQTTEEKSLFNTLEELRVLQARRVEPAI